MIMTLPICYLITNFPIFIILILQFCSLDNHTRDQYKLELTIAKVFMYINNSINIIFYIFLGKSFNKVFIDLIFKKFYIKFICIKK